MGTYYRGQIECFEPDNTDSEIYISTAYAPVSMEEIMEACINQWGTFDLSKIKIEAEYIHTDCIGYDRYDPGDYTKYLKITRI